MIVHGMSASGNCYKLQLLLAQLRKPHQWHEVNILLGESRTPEFLAKNPNGKVPLLELEDGRCLAESNAILCYLAEGSSFLPEDRFLRAQVLQWLFFEQYSHEPYIAVARFICRWLPADHARRAELPRLHERGYQALDVMERHLHGRDFLVDGRYSIADIALYAYTHEAHVGGFDLSRYAAISRWLNQVEHTHDFVPQRY
jgi:glutathione S-transferase